MVIRKNKPNYIFLLIIIHYFIAVQGTLGQDLFFEKIQDPQIAIDTRIISITKDSVGYMWFGTWNGLYRYDGEHFYRYKYPFDEGWPFLNNRIRNIITGEDQQIWILTSDQKHIRYHYAQDAFHLIEREGVPDSIVVLLESSPNELHSSKRINQFSYFIESNHFCSLDEQTGEKKVYYPDIYQPGHLRDEYVSTYYIDNQDIIWIGTRNGKIYKANTNRNSFKLHPIYKEGKRTPILTSVTSIFKNGDELWLGTEYDGIFVLDEASEQLIDHPINTGSVAIDKPRMIREDTRGNIWIGAMDGLYIYSPPKRETRVVLDIKTMPKIYNPNVYSISEANNGYMWAGVHQGLAKINMNTLDIIRYDYHREFGRRTVRDIFVDEKQRIWVGTEGYCLFRFTYDATGKCIDTLRIKDFKALTNGRLDGDCIYSIYEDSYGKVWVGTTEGLFRIDPLTMKVDLYDEAEGLADLYITAIAEDKQRNIWVSHKKGISKIDQADNSISNFLISDDSENWIFNEGSGFNDRKNNTIYFGANEGYVSFNPEEIKSNPFAPKLVLSSLYISGNRISPNQEINNQRILEKALCLTDEITLDYHNRNFGIDLSALNFQNTIGHTYQYQLIGYHEEWISTKYDHISFMKIPFGKYVLNAKAISSDGGESNPVSLKIVIRPPWYATRLAILSYMLLLTAIFLIAYRIRRSRQEMKKKLLIERLNTEKQEEITQARLEFFTNVSHELRTPLSLIIDPLRQLRNDNLAQNKRSSYLKLITKNVEQLSQLINQILDFRKAEEKKLLPNHTILDGMQAIYDVVMDFDLMARKRDIQLTFEPSNRELVGYFDGEKLRQIMQNLVSNAFKYTPDHGSVRITASTNPQDNELAVMVEDSGIGIEKQALQKIFEPFNSKGSRPFYGESSGMGLALTKNLIELLGGKIFIESEPNQGTQARFFLPYQKAEQAVADPVVQTALEAPERSTAEILSEHDKKPVVLVVEDNADLQFYLKTELSDAYHILIEGNGVDGLNTAVSQIPDLVISDVMMPEMDGNEMCKKIKTNDKTSHIPVILLTAKGADQDRVEGLRVGADVYFSKPFNIEVLKAQIVSIIENRIALQKNLAERKEVAMLESEQNELDKRFMHSTIEIIQQNIDEIGFNPEQLAENLQISQRQLYRKLKAITGSTVSEFIIRIRMEKASELLKDWQLNISEVAYQVGFSEASNFSRTFRKHFGCSPSRYREQL